MSLKEFLQNRQQRVNYRFHRLWGDASVGRYDRREWQEFQDTLSEYFSEVEKLIEEHDRKSNTDQKD
jgi:hypothetical protein